jgi:hypothetical protein
MARGLPITESQTENKKEVGEPSRPSFTWQLPTGNSKRPRSPEDEEISVSRRRRASTSFSKHYIDESSDEVDSADDDYQVGKRRSTGSARRARRRKSGANKRRASSTMVPSANMRRTEAAQFPALASLPMSPSIAITTSALPSWLPEFTTVDKAAALRWVITRQRPVDFLHNLQSWLEFADMVSPS